MLIGYFVISSRQNLPVPTGNWESGKRGTIKRTIFGYINPLKKILRNSDSQTSKQHKNVTFFKGHTKGGCTVFKNGDHGFFSSGFSRSHTWFTVIVWYISQESKFSLDWQRFRVSFSWNVIGIALVCLQKVVAYFTLKSWGTSLLTIIFVDIVVTLLLIKAIFVSL